MPDQPPFFTLLEELFEIGEGSLTGAERLTDLPEWSSLTFVALIAMVDEEYGVTLAPKEILGAENVAELATLLESKTADSRAA